MPLAKLNWGFKPKDPMEQEALPMSQSAQSHSTDRESLSLAEQIKRNELQDTYSELKVKIHRRLIEAIDFTQLTEPDTSTLRLQIKEAIHQLLSEEDVLITAQEREQLNEDILNEIMGLGPLEPLLQDPTVNDILINGPDLIFIERQGLLEETRVRFKDEEHLMQIIDRVVSPIGRRVDESQPLCDARLRDGSRFNCIIPPLALDGPMISIRKFAKDPYTIEDLIHFGTLTEDAAKLLQGFIGARLNIIISGGTGSGKTTLLNVLSGFVPERERIVTIEDAAELQLRQRHIVRLETRPPNIEGKGEISQRELFRNALRMRPDRVIVGECRAGESLDMLQAMNTGHDGSMTTLHANSPRDAIRRLETMVLMAGYDLPQRAIREQIASAIHVIIQLSRLSDGSRRVMNITEVVGMEGEVILLQDIFQFHKYGVDECQKIQGEFQYTGIRPNFLEVLQKAGIEVDLSFFKA